MESQNRKCQDLPKFQFLEWGGVLEPNSRTGVFWRIWSKISGSLACLCITDSLSHTTYVGLVKFHTYWNFQYCLICSILK